MKYCKITKPIGLEDVCNEIERICSEAHVYKQCGLRPPHLAIQLDSGSAVRCINIMCTAYPVCTAFSISVLICRSAFSAEHFLA